jgi:hypothetical protein
VPHPRQSTNCLVSVNVHGRGRAKGGVEPGVDLKRDSSAEERRCERPRAGVGVGGRPRLSLLFEDTTWSVLRWRPQWLSTMDCCQRHSATAGGASAEPSVRTLDGVVGRLLANARVRARHITDARSASPLSAIGRVLGHLHAGGFEHPRPALRGRADSSAPRGIGRASSDVALPMKGWLWLFVPASPSSSLGEVRKAPGQLLGPSIINVKRTATPRVLSGSRPCKAR